MPVSTQLGLLLWKNFTCRRRKVYPDYGRSNLHCPPTTGVCIHCPVPPFAPMSTLSTKSDQEISQLLDDYGIKHGPVVGTTRTLYEKKLKEAMAKGSKQKPPSDKTYYREEQEEVTYVHYRSPLRSEGFGESSSVRRHITPEYTRETDMDYAKEPTFHRTAASYSQVSHSRPALQKLSRDASTKETVPQQSRFIPLWFQFLVFLVVAAFLYFVFTSMETPAANPFNKLE